MYYNKFQNIELSALGLGCMRLPVIDGDDSRPDAVAVEEMVAYAMQNGINYYDTAWGYHSGNSEIVMGNALAKYPRESFYLASKFPGYDLSNMDKVEEIFEKQLEKCRVDYFDFYLFHNVCEMNINQYLDPKYGIYNYLTLQRDSGRIKHLGFSAHGSYEVIERFLKAYGDDMEFCQLQINYIDWEFQNAVKKVELVRSYGIPVFVMEPVRGGKLAGLDAQYERKLKEMRPDESVLAWAFRFLQSIDATVILSGMSNFEQLKQNIELFREKKPLDDDEMKTLLGMARDMVNPKTVPCTACRYCTTHCPMELDIPFLLNLYNEHFYSDGGFIAPMALMSLPEDKQPSACIGCGSCEAVCPQQINIPEALASFCEMLKQEE
ncbi:MAG: aldo/keto reductase [Clostridia bacterium]|nr:aldo/keto reductase [Clostridia bacterium]